MKIAKKTNLFRRKHSPRSFEDNSDDFEQAWNPAAQYGCQDEKTPCHIFLKVINDTYIDTVCNTKDSQLEYCNISLVCIKSMPITEVSEALKKSYPTAETSWVGG